MASTPLPRFQSFGNNHKFGHHITTLTIIASANQKFILIITSILISHFDHGLSEATRLLYPSSEVPARVRLNKAEVQQRMTFPLEPASNPPNFSLTGQQICTLTRPSRI
jgi:hypothetical protein